MAKRALLSVSDKTGLVEFAHALGQVVQRNEMSAEVADLIFVRIAHVENEQVISRVQALL